MNVPEEVAKGVEHGLSYIIGPSGWNALPVVDVRRAPPPKLTPLNALRRLDNSLDHDKTTPEIEEAIGVLWEHLMRESGQRK